MAKIFTSYSKLMLSIYNDRFTTRSRINEVNANVQTLLSCLKRTTLDGLGVHLNVFLY